MPEKTGSIFLWAGESFDHQLFVQDSSFYYFTGINEPGVVLQLMLDGKTRLFIPNTQGRRVQWVSQTYDTSRESCVRAGVDEIVSMGDPITGYYRVPLCAERDAHFLLDVLREAKASGVIFTPVPDGSYALSQYISWNAVSRFIPDIFDAFVDIRNAIASLRRTKDEHELALIMHAVQITQAAHADVAHALEDGVSERMLQAHIAATLTMFGSDYAYAPMVAAGASSALPHYELNTGVVRSGDIVMVDCGARFEHYCADITRTYPVDGTFSKRQLEVYETVFACQELLASLAKPGMYLSNSEIPELSLYHQAQEFFKKRDLDTYIVHGIGHFLGLDVHDVSVAGAPLQEGDVITIEPGLYLPQEKFGVRIEDDYLLVKDGAYSLSDDLPKKCDDLYKLLSERDQACDTCCSSECHHH